MGTSIGQIRWLDEVVTALWRFQRIRFRGKVLFLATGCPLFLSVSLDNFWICSNLRGFREEDADEDNDDDDL